MSNSSDLHKQALAKIRELKNEIKQLRAENHVDIAIIGMSCRFPGGITNTSEYWDVLKNGIDCITSIPPERFNAAAFYDEDPAIAGKMYVRQGGFISGIDQFDPEFFNINRREANSMDPQQRLLLEMSVEALEDAQLNRQHLAGSQTGVFIGVCSQDYARLGLYSSDAGNIDIYSFTGVANSIAGGRLSHFFGFNGPNITIDTACSSSLVAVHQAVRSLRTGESNLALAGGVNLILSPESFICLCKVNALSPDARCKTFDNAANGYVRAEGGGMIVLKRLQDALQDNDPIHAIIAGSAVNQDGQRYNLTAPNGSAQRALLKSALADANISPLAVNYIEAHGTGTPLGDPIEVAALADVYAKDRGQADALLIGSVKTNIGHTEAVSGMAGLIKVVLSLQNKAIPANLHFNLPNQQINWHEHAISIPRTLQAWPVASEKRIAGVSAFGFSGTNAHVLLTEAPAVINPCTRELPKTIFNRQHCWLPSPDKLFQPRHPLLGAPLLSPQLSGLCYATDINLNELAYLRSHPVFGETVMPGSGFIEMAISAGDALFNTEKVCLRNIVYKEPLIMRDNEITKIQTLLSEKNKSTYHFEIVSMDARDASWHSHVTGIITTHRESQPESELDLPAIQARCERELDREAFYQTLEGDGYIYGIDHRGVDNVWLNDNEVLAKIVIPSTIDKRSVPEYYYHPAFLDSAYQLLLLLLPTVEPEEIYITLGKEKVIQYGRPGATLWVHTQKSKTSTNSIIKADVRIYDEMRLLINETSGYLMKRTKNKKQSLANVDYSYQISWELSTNNVKNLQNTFSDKWLIFVDRKGFADKLSAAMQDHLINHQLINRDEPYQLERDNTPTRLIYCCCLDDEMNAEQQAPYGLSALKSLIQQIHKNNSIKSFTLITKNAQRTSGRDSTVDPLQAIYWGLIKTLHIEMPQLHFNIIDIDDLSASVNIRKFLEIIYQADYLEQLYALRNNQYLVPRLVKNRISEETDNTFLKLQMTERGNLSSLKLTTTSRCKLADYEVEIKVCVSGLNFRDVIDALGMHPRQLEEFGLECAGVVTNVGAKVKTVKINDEVIAIGIGAMGEYFITHEKLVFNKPKKFSFQEAVTFPIAFLTAFYAIHVNGKIKSGDKILIHAAAGGVGLAAVQLALQAGAEVFATASSKKWDILQSYGVKYIMDSRSHLFSDEIQKTTDGLGVDIVMNSLGEPFLASSLSCLKPGGKLLEIGIKGSTIESVRQIRPDINYVEVNLMAKWEEDPDSVREMFSCLQGYFHADKPLNTLPYTEFMAHDSIAAFRTMQQGKHTGKIVISQLRQSFSGTQVITGGLGAIGLELVSYLISQGATHLVLLGRTTPSKKIASAIQQLTSHAVTIAILQADVADSQQLDCVLSHIRKNMPPITGIFHTAGIAENGYFHEMDDNKLINVLQPKVQGTLNLHHLTLHDPIQHFVLFSSMTSLFGFPGVAGYAAANAFLDAFSYFRQSLDLPAMSIAWGPWSDTDMFQLHSGSMQEQLVRRGLTLLNKQQNINYFDLLLQQRHSLCGAFVIDWQKWLANNTNRSEIAFLSELYSAKKHAPLEIQKKIKPHAASQAELIDMIKSHVLEILSLENADDLEIDTGFFELGMDSLTSIELRNRLLSQSDYDLPATLTFDYPNIKALAEFLAQQISADVQHDNTMMDVPTLTDDEILQSLQEI